MVLSQDDKATLDLRTSHAYEAFRFAVEHPSPANAEYASSQYVGLRDAFSALGIGSQPFDHPRSHPADRFILQYALGLSASSAHAVRVRSGEENRASDADRELLAMVEGKRTPYKTIAERASRLGSEGNLLAVISALQHVRNYVR